MESRCAIKLKATAALTQVPQGDVIWKMLNKLDPGKSVEDDLQALEVMEMIAKEEAEENTLAGQVLAEEVS